MIQELLYGGCAVLVLDKKESIPKQEKRKNLKASENKLWILKIN